jgi:hypothetical protein
VSVVTAFTKFDVVILIESGKFQTHDRARNNVDTRYEQSCRFLFRKNPKDVPAEIVRGTLFPPSAEGPLTSPFVL